MKTASVGHFGNPAILENEGSPLVYPGSVALRPHLTMGLLLSMVL
jgi:hypothetical protein